MRRPGLMRGAVRVGVVGWAMLWSEGTYGQGTAGERLQALAAAQQQALAGGDGAAVLATSKALGAEAARVLGDVAAAGGRWAEAEAWYRESAEVEESEAARLGVVVAAAHAGKAGEAEAAADDAVRAEGDSARLRLTLGEAMHSAGDVNGTIRQLQRAVAIDAGSAGAHLALGSAFWELNYFQYNADSLREFGEAVRLQPGSGLANFDLGSVLSEYGRYGESKGYLEKAAELEPDSPDAVLQLGMDAWAEARVEEARADLTRAVSLTGAAVDRNNYQIRRALAVLSRIDADAGRDGEATREAEEAEELRRKVGQSEQVGAITESVGLVAAVSPKAAVVRAEVVAGDATEQLETQLREVLAQSLNDAGTAMARDRDYAGALPLFRRAAAADGDLLGVERNLGLAAFHTQAWKEAADALEKAAAQQPGDELVARDLAEARAHLEGGGRTP